MMASSLVALAGWGLRSNVSNHRVHYAGLDPHLQARCSCKQKSPVGSRADVDTWYYSHLAEIERIRTHLGTRNPSLNTQWAWFSEQAVNEDNPTEDRALWRQMADEMAAFIEVKNAPALQQDPLF